MFSDKSVQINFKWTALFYRPQGKREWTLDEKVGISGVSTYESRFKDIGGSFILKRKLVWEYKSCKLFADLRSCEILYKVSTWANMCLIFIIGWMLSDDYSGWLISAHYSPLYVSLKPALK